MRTSQISGPHQRKQREKRAFDLRLDDAAAVSRKKRTLKSRHDRDDQEFTILIGAVIGSAVIPTVIAQRWFAPPVHMLTTAEVEEIEDEEFEPAPRHVR